MHNFSDPCLWFYLGKKEKEHSEPAVLILEAVGGAAFKRDQKKRAENLKSWYRLSFSRMFQKANKKWKKLKNPISEISANSQGGGL